MEQLKKCPFCGGEVKIRGGAEDWAPTFYDPDSGGDPYYISCECGLSFSIDSYEIKELVIAWNTRKPMERIAEQLEEEKEKALDLFDGNSRYKGFDKAIKIVKEEI